MPVIHNCVIHIFEIDSSVAISDFVGNWTQESLNEEKESPHHSYPVSCQEITDHETSDTKLLCTAFPEGIPSYSLPEFSLFGGNLTFHEHSEMFGNLVPDGKVKWYDSGKVVGIWKRTGTLSIINHENSKNHFF